MSWVAAAVGVGSALVANNASNQQAASGRAAAGMSLDMYQDTAHNLDPFLQQGKIAVNNLASYLGQGGATTAPTFDPNAPGVKPFSLADFQASPAYNFNLQQGQQAIDKASNARGNMYAPQTLQDISKFSQGLASNEFSNAYNMYNQNQSNVVNRLSGLANSGQSAAVQQGGFGANAGANWGNAQMQVGNANAAGTVGMYGNLMQGGADVYNNYLQNQILNRQQQSTYGAYGGGSPIGAGGFS